MTGPNTRGKLDLDPEVVRRARNLAARAAEPVIRMARTHTTVSVERALLRLSGLSGADAEGRPWANHLVDAVQAQVGLEHGVALPVWDALASGGHGSLAELAAAAAAGRVSFRLPAGADARTAHEAAR
ncbi:lysine 5,6-aminomutase subunit alpha TIM-barrel domain-containing protein, partial [Actinomadura logoneensis]|uniref:lysine 5,6-aminomutase subunit alpha TIM-barrel domain-containing protein n=1 Tax=Actinomadura logoneensis TaxID=2293572 RepID=UPI002E26CC62